MLKTCSHIEGHMNRFEYCHPDNNSDNDSFGPFLSKNRIFCSVDLHFMKVSTGVDNHFGYERVARLVENIPLAIFFYLLLYRTFNGGFFSIKNNKKQKSI